MARMRMTGERGGALGPAWAGERGGACGLTRVGKRKDALGPARTEWRGDPPHSLQAVGERKGTLGPERIGELEGARELAYALRCARAVLAFSALWLAATMLGEALAGPARLVVPGFVRAERLATLEGAMDDESRALVERCYGAPNASGVRSFCGDPRQLSPRSRLARALDAAASFSRADTEGVLRAFTGQEYAALGRDLAAQERASTRASLRDLALCALLLHALRRASRRLEATLVHKS